MRKNANTWNCVICGIEGHILCLSCEDNAQAVQKNNSGSITEAQVWKINDLHYKFYKKTNITQSEVFESLSIEYDIFTLSCEQGKKVIAKYIDMLDELEDAENMGLTTDSKSV